MDATEGMTRETAFMQAVMEQAEVTMAKVGEQGATSAASIARIQASVENTALGIGQKFIPVLQKVLVPIADLVQRLGPKLVEWAGVIADWMGQRLPVMIMWAIDAFERFQGVIQTVVNVIAQFMRGTPGDFPWEDIFPPKLAEFAYKLSAAFETIRDAINTFIDSLSRGIVPAFALRNALMEVIPFELADTIGRIIWNVQQFVGTVVDSISDFVSWKDVLIALGIGLASIVLPAIAGLITSIIALAAPILLVIGAVALLRTAWEKDFLGIQGIVETLVSTVGQVIQGLAELFGQVMAAYQESGISGVFELLAQRIVEAWPTIRSTLAEWGQKFWDWLIQDALPLAAEKISAFVGSVTTKLIEAWPNIRSTLAKWGVNFWTWLTEDVIPLAGEKIGQFAASVVMWLGDKWPDVWAALKAWGENAWEWLTETVIPFAGEKIGKLAATIATAIEDVWPDIQAAFETWGVSLWTWLTETGIPQTSEKMGQLSEAIITWAQGPEGMAAGEAIGKAIVDGIVASISALMGGGFLAGKMSLSMKQIPGQLAEATATMGANIVSGIVDAIAERLGIEISEPVASALQEGFEMAFGLMNPVAFLRKMTKDTVKALKTLVKAFKKPFDDLWKTVVKPVLDRIMKLWHQLFGNSELIDVVTRFGGPGIIAPSGKSIR
jgi:hypothetical protein